MHRSILSVYCGQVSAHCDKKDKWNVSFPTDRVRIAAAFFLSGMAALIYQVAWQRLLFVVVGVDLESITIVVSTFMMGLGLGALIGGWIADRIPQRILVVFCLVEAGIALFGFMSVELILGLSHTFAGLSRSAAATLSFVILLFPTLCMGATLPMLIADAFRQSRNIGMSTGSLYFINTLGAALGAFAVGFVLFYWLDIRQSVAVAAATNLTASLIVATLLMRRARV